MRFFTSIFFGSLLTCVIIIHVFYSPYWQAYVCGVACGAAIVSIIWGWLLHRSHVQFDRQAKMTDSVMKSCRQLAGMCEEYHKMMDAYDRALNNRNNRTHDDGDWWKKL